MKRKGILILPFLILILTGCLYNNEEELFGCDTTSVTYTGSVLPILQTYCFVCHSNEQVSLGNGGGNRLEEFNVLRTLALNGTLVGAIEHAPGFTPMPLFGNKLSSCNISIIKAWIDDGALNN